MVTETTDVLIIGAGPSGCVAAAHLINQGIKVKIVEKNRFPRFVIGESLLPRCMDHFKEVGLLEALSKQGFEIKKGARFLKGNKVCNFDFSKKSTEGFNWTWQMPRADFDDVLARTIIERGADIRFEIELLDVKFNDDGSSISIIKPLNAETYSIEANFIIDASGFGRVLPRLLDLDKPSGLPQLGSIFTHVKESVRPDGREGTLITFDVVTDESWIWVIPFSNGITSLGYVGPIALLDSIKKSPTAKLKELLETSNHYFERFKDLDFEFEPWEIKNYSKSVKKLYGKGFALTGNSAEFLDPVFSSGVTFATESGLLAAKLIAKELQGITVDWEVEYSQYIKKGVGVFATYVKEWYTGNLQKIFFHANGNPEIKRNICAVLAGYVWDETNPFVKKHDRLLKTVANYIDIENSIKKGDL